MLSTDEAKVYYDSFGSKQDSQGFYEDPATNLLIEHADFPEATAIFEFGIGTGRFADKLLSSILPPSCSYSGVDVSTTMINIAEKRLRKYGARAVARVSLGSTKLSEDSNSYDRFISNYVLDLLSDQEASAVVDDAYRVLRTAGLLCMVSLTMGRTLPSRVVSSIWHTIYRINAKLVGGCRPIELRHHLSESNWTIECCKTVSAFGITSEVVVARKLPVPSA
jgi:ubiquinone/menaquinone biosynthesis C-methylase UbiE